MPNVAYCRPEYTDKLPLWMLVKDCVAGEKEVKSKTTNYLPQPNASDLSTENRERYKAYVARAVFYNVTGRTLAGLIGEVFAKEPVHDIPETLDILLEDADGSGVEMDHLAKKALAYTLAFGRGGILTDYPTTDVPTSLADAESGAIRPTLNLYPPEVIINWRVETFGAKKLLTLVVLKESQIAEDDGFETKYKDVYRVLRLIDGVYFIEVWEQVTDKAGRVADFTVTQRIAPRNAAGGTWSEIPFTFIGSENNDADPDSPPMSDIATLNIAHYRNSADYEEAIFILGQPTPWISGLNQGWIDDVLKGAVMLGSRSAIPLPANGAAGLLQALPNTMVKEGMDAKEIQMVALGAKLVEQQAVNKTATQASLNDASQTSILATCAENVSCAIEKALKWAIGFAGGTIPDELSYELNTDFVITKLSAQEQAQAIANWQANATSWTEMRDVLRQGGVAFQKDEDAKAEIDSAGPHLGMPVPAAAADAETQRLANETAAAKAKAGRPPA